MSVFHMRASIISCIVESFKTQHLGNSSPPHVHLCGVCLLTFPSRCACTTNAGDASAAQQPLGFWELLEYIVMEAPPTLQQHGGSSRFSPELCDFVSQCLVKEAPQRPSIDALADHPFLKTHTDTNLADVLKWAMGVDA
jgi:hypothetical protein